MNLVLDDVEEVMRGECSWAQIHSSNVGWISLFFFFFFFFFKLIFFIADDEGNESPRSLGLVVSRGTLIVLISPAEGTEQIANPFLQSDE